MTTPSNEPLKNQSPESPSQPSLANQEAPSLPEESLAAQQEQYRKAYIEQLRRMSCPGCGDDGDIPL